jgi:hypothetical protein
LDQYDLRDLLGYNDLRVYKDLNDSLELQEQYDHKDLLERQEQYDHKDLLEHRELLELWDPKVQVSKISSIMGIELLRSILLMDPQQLLIYLVEVILLGELGLVYIQ